MQWFHQPVTFVRHGQTEWNVARKVRGSQDAPLTEEGRAQARALADALSRERFDLLVHSPLHRAVTTASIVNECLGIRNIQEHAGFSERYFGILEGMEKERIRRDHAALLGQRGYIRLDADPPEGEHGDAFRRRTVDGLLSLKPLSAEHRILVVTHGAVMRAIDWIVHDKDPEAATVFGNGEHYVVH